MIKLDLCTAEAEETNEALISVCHLVASRGTTGVNPGAHTGTAALMIIKKTPESSHFSGRKFVPVGSIILIDFMLSWNPKGADSALDSPHGKD